MSDAEDTRLVPTTAEAPQETEPSDDVIALPENVTITELPEGNKNSSLESVKSDTFESSKDEATGIAANGKKNSANNYENKNSLIRSNETDRTKIQLCPPPQSRCRVRSRDTRQCKKHFREMIGKHELRNDELEQHETDLRQRLEMLECSMPAVMVWNIWRMAQGAPVSHLRNIVEKQFLEPAAGFSMCPTTPSQHWDCRVREVEAERKQAKHRTEEARKVFAVREDALKLQKQQIEEAKRLQAERKTQIAKLEEEVKRLQDALRKAQGDDNSCETGECGEIQCRQMWLQDAASVSSIHSTDLECLARLQDLAEAELCMKRQIADLERRECAYMRTLQQADEMWAKMEDDNASNLDDLKEQLDAKISANQKLANRIVELEDEIEKLRAQITKTSAALGEYTGKTFVEVGLGDVNVSTEEKIEQTEDEAENVIMEELQSKQDEENFLKSYSTIAKTNLDTTEDAVQAKPNSEDAETQSATKEPGQEKETGTEEKTQIETPTNTETVSGEKISDDTEEHVEELVAAPNELRQFENKGSLAEILKTPSEDKYTEALEPVKTEDRSTERKEEFPEIPQNVAPEIIKADIQDTNEEISEADVKTTVEIADEVSARTTPEANVVIEAVSEPITKAGGTTSPEPPLDVPSEPVIQSSPVTSREISKESISAVINEKTPEAFSVPTTEASPGPVNEPVLNDVVASAPQKQAVDIIEEPDFKPESPDFIEPVKNELPANTSAIPIQTLLAWHNIVVCVQRQISSCSRCSSTNEDICQTLDEIRAHLGKDAPDLAEIKCRKFGGETENSIPLPNKKGRCICKPKTCPLDGATTAASPQASVQIQTVVDGQSQTPIPVKTPSREPRGLKSSKGSMKSKEDVKLTSIEEGTEPDLGIQGLKSIPQAKDESTVTVGDIASQTETIPKPPSSSKDVEKLCVCPTGICPKKDAKPVTRKAPAKEYRSTAEAILAPAIKVLSPNECASTQLLRTAKNDNINSASSSSACCICGKPLTPVASRKTTSIPRPMKSMAKNKVTLASENSDDDFLCCTCKAKSSSNGKPRAKKSSDKSMEAVRTSHRVQGVSDPIKTSCSREVCCSCDTQEIHDLPKTLSTDSEVSKSKIKPETKDVCCLAKISRDKTSKTGSRRRNEEYSIQTTPLNIPSSVSGQFSSSSSAYNTASRTSDGSDSNVCCSSIEQVVGMTKKKSKGTRCACDGNDTKGNKKKCVCGEDVEGMDRDKGKHIERSESCVCPPKLFEKC